MSLFLKKVHFQFTTTYIRENWTEQRPCDLFKLEAKEWGKRERASAKIDSTCGYTGHQLKINRTVDAKLKSNSKQVKVLRA